MRKVLALLSLVFNMAPSAKAATVYGDKVFKGNIDFVSAGGNGVAWTNAANTFTLTGDGSTPGDGQIIVTNIKGSDTSTDSALYLNTVASPTALSYMINVANLGDVKFAVRSDGSVISTADWYCDANITIRNNKELQFFDNGANYVGFEAPALSANQIWVLPASDTAGALTSDGGGNLSWNTFATDTINDTHIDWGTGANQVSAADIPVAVIGSPTYTTVQHQLDHVMGAGRVSGGAVTDAGGETVNIAAGTGWVKATDDDVAQVLSFNWSQVSGAAITTDTVRYVQVAYTGGSPVASVVTSESWDFDTSFPLAKVVNQGGTLHILNNPWWTGEGLTNVMERFQAAGHLVRDAHVGGLSLSVPGTRNVAVTAGTLWSRLNEFTITALDTNVTGTFELYYRSGASTWSDSDLSQYPVTQWNRLSDNSLQNMSNNNYANLWVFAEADDDDISMVYPQAEYNSASGAEAESPPTALPRT